MGELSVTHWLIVAVVVVLLFGAKRLPDAARGLGRSMRILKAEIRAQDDTEQPAITAQTQTQAHPQPHAGSGPTAPAPEPPATGTASA